MSNTHPFISGSWSAQVPTPALLEAFRAEAKAKTDLEPPTHKHEEWRFSEVKSVTNRELNPVWSGTIDAKVAKAFEIEECDGNVVLSVNGAIQSLPSASKVQVGRLEDLDAAAQGAVKDAIGHGASYWSDVFKSQNDMLASDVLCVVVPPDTSAELPLHLLNVGNAAADSVFANRTIIVIGRNSKARLVEEYRSADEGQNYFRNAVTEVLVGENAHVTHIRVQDEGPKAQHLLRSSVRLGANSHYDSYTISVGGAWARHDLLARHEGEGAFARIDGLALLVDEQLSDTHTIIDNTRPHCNSHQLHKIVAGGKGHAVFNGKIFVQKGAQKIDAYQLNRSLLLSDKAKVDAKPQLEIFADDVRCTHGATIGQLDDEQVFYLKSRGYDEQAARGMLTYAFAGEVLDEIDVPSLRQRLIEIARSRTR